MSGALEGGGYSADFREFDRKFLNAALIKYPEAAEKGLFEALSELKNDADNVPPRTPHLEGNLRGDYTFILDGIRNVKIVEKSGGKGSNHAPGGEKPVLRPNAKNIIVKLIFRMPYAARWHETTADINWSEDGVGPKYVESKLATFGEKYMGITAAPVRALSGG